MKNNPYRGERGQRNRESILDYFESEPDEWIDVATLAAITGMHKNSVRVHCTNLTMIKHLEEARILKGFHKLICYRRRR